MKNKINQKGQVLLIALLTVFVLSTIALSVVSRSVTDVAVTTREEESLRAFSAAEAGLEEALITGSVVELARDSIPPIERDLGVVSESGSSIVSNFRTEVSRYPENLRAFNYPFKLFSGMSGTVSFVTRGDEGAILPCSDSTPCFNGNLVTVCWGEEGASEVPAVYIDVIFRNLNTGRYGKSSIGFDPVSSRRTGGDQPNNFVQSAFRCHVGTGENARLYPYFGTIDFGMWGVSGQPILMRVKMLYNNTVPQPFGVVTQSDLPAQGKRVDSRGAAGEITRRINAFLLNPEIPFIFDSAIYSDSGIVK